MEDSDSGSPAAAPLRKCISMPWGPSAGSRRVRTRMHISHPKIRHNSISVRYTWLRPGMTVKKLKAGFNSE